MLEVMAQIVICLIIAALMGGVIGYLLGKNSCEKINNKLKEKTNSILEIDKQIIRNENLSNIKILGVAPLLLPEARKEGKDDLQLINGIENVLENLLNEIGIYHFDQIANLNEEEIAWLDNAIMFPGRIKREKWIIQAKELILV